MDDVTGLLKALEVGGRGAADELMIAVYGELRRLARVKMANERPGQTLQPTALVHEAWLRIGKDARFKSRSHFFGAAAEAMRRILVESARRKKCAKRGGDSERVDVSEVEIPLPVPGDELLALDEALTRLTVIEPQAAEVVKLCYFVGLTQPQAAEELGISTSTAERHWRFARAWLFREINESENRSG